MIGAAIDLGNVMGGMLAGFLVWFLVARPIINFIGKHFEEEKK